MRSISRALAAVIVATFITSLAPNFADAAESQPTLTFALKIQTLEQQADQRKLGSDEIKRLEQEIDRLLEPNVQSKLGLDIRTALAEQILKHTFDPSTVQNGHHNTALVAALETEVYRNHPALAAKVVADIALHGSINTDTETAIILDDRNLECLDAETERTYASQLFQIAMANAYCQTQRKDPNGRSLKKGKMQFVQTNERRSASDTGERIYVTHEDGTKETILKDGSFEPMSDLEITSKGLEIAYTFLTGRADCTTYGALAANQNPSKFITLGETTVITRSATKDSVALGSGWNVAKSTCKNGVCTRKPQFVANSL